MIGRLDGPHGDIQQVDARQRADLILAEARAQLSSRLWQAALGTGDDGAAVAGTGGAGSEFSLDSLIAMFSGGLDARGAAPAMASPQPSQPPIAYGDGGRDMASARRRDGDGDGRRDDGDAGEVGGLGPNARYRATLQSAAARTGIPAAALAAIVNAESARDNDGRWLEYSRNPRSSAAGLGQFLAGTWQGETERPGTWLNTVARANGWLDAAGKVRDDARSALLALRYDGDASINAIADYARSNIDQLEKRGLRVGEGAEAIAEIAYLGHHLGLGDAARFLRNGGLDPDRARLLLNAQVGTARASERIAAAGDASSAHRAWLLDYVGRNLRPDRFQVLESKS
ncbi:MULTISPECIES: hypothetical protein [Sphingomonadales]|uniref:Peptidoglycan-binding protein n=1 Tax=Edaphosphingomonas haloaromaticamans TaxID=653954 RepID=A0A1S1HJB2_9SPHN|nr:MULTISPECIES: hypothetical protein [Sphingomonas]AGH49075.1 peptidoglycan-binding protein [Sphingomonas sp. MM-1]MDX3883695.1 peptidoglycan-binding protein [Sphingomonas sp.]OHT21496.1 hypothetical protein BHE75_03504 [Sphingomonas haloaromaticamans]